MDVLDRPDLSGGWEEIWRSLEVVEFFDLDVVTDYTLLLENRPHGQGGLLPGAAQGGGCRED